MRRTSFLQHSAEADPFSNGFVGPFAPWGRFVGPAGQVQWRRGPIGAPPGLTASPLTAPVDARGRTGLLLGLRSGRFVCDDSNGFLEMKLLVSW